MKIPHEPVAVRCVTVVFLLGAANRGQAIGDISEKVEGEAPSRNIFGAKTSDKTASAGKEEISN